MITTTNNREEFEDVYTRYYRVVYGIIRSRIGHHEDAEDMASDVFYWCYKNYHLYDPTKAQVQTWIRNRVESKLKNYYRDKKHSVTIDDDENPIELPFESDMDNAIYIEGMSAHLYHALDTLSERERTIVARHYFREETFDAIASDLGITSGNARTIMNRTIKKIAEYFTNHNVEWK